jgi:DNA-directed RNA polymerase specialized sigma24 family protein
MEFLEIVSPLSDKLYRFAFNLIPDDLQAEQLVIDAFNAFLIKEKKNILFKELESQDKKSLQLLRRSYFKAMLSYMAEIGARRSIQLMEQMKLSRPAEFNNFFGLEAKVRAVLTLRYDFQFTVVEIEDILHMPRYEVIEKLHNGRFLLVNTLNQGAQV